jgi:hypothetical protein
MPNVFSHLGGRFALAHNPGMAQSADNRRRWLGGGFLGGALAMLLAGETVLKDRLSPAAFVFFWLGCMVLTGLAMLVAILDFGAQQRRAREEQRKLFENTLDDIVRKQNAQSQKPPADDAG